MILSTTDGRIGRGRRNLAAGILEHGILPHPNATFCKYFDIFAFFLFAIILSHHVLWLTFQTYFIRLQSFYYIQVGAIVHNKHEKRWGKSYLQQLNIHGRLRGRRSLEAAVLS